mmetsp:Transcript_28144/g.61310  ORF Transcript_28144/g.61310 Transcript_28144/m.61310 type:complete len:343 (+) Transcript_28144:119-1147(+)
MPRWSGPVTIGGPRKVKGKERGDCWSLLWKLTAQFLLIGILSIYAVAMWFGMRYLLYHSDLHSMDETLPATIISGTNPTNHREGTAKIKAISILGERNSGTRWLYDHLNECFNHSVPIKRELVRYKHWFQDPTYNQSKILDDTLVVTIWRNVYEWVEAMRKTPHHASNHLWLDWKVFVTRPWTTERVGGDLLLASETGRLCQEGFRYNEVVSCLKHPLPREYWQGRNHSYSERQPFYELRNDGSGKPYNSVVDLRAAKIRNFLSTAEYDGVSALWILRYEDLIKEGTARLIKKLEAATGRRAKCTPFAAQGDRHRRQLDMKMIKWLMKHVDWETEALIGYYP